MIRYFLALLFVVSILAASATAGPVNYTYDPAGRLTSVDYGNGQTITYAYDNAGNLLSRTVATPASGQTTAAPDTASPKVPVTEKSRPAGRTTKPRPKQTAPLVRPKPLLSWD